MIQELSNKEMESQHLKFSTKQENISLVEKLIENVCEEYKINDSQYGNVLVAVTEAVYNALNHGNKLNPSKNINVSFQETDHKLVFTVADEGDGFDPNAIPDPTSPENIEKENGRGVFLIKNLADEVSFDDHGREVKMIFNLSKN